MVETAPPGEQGVARGEGGINLDQGRPRVQIVSTGSEGEGGNLDQEMIPLHEEVERYT